MGSDLSQKIIFIPFHHIHSLLRNQQKCNVIQNSEQLSKKKIDFTNDGQLPKNVNINYLNWNLHSSRERPRHCIEIKLNEVMWWMMGWVKNPIWISINLNTSNSYNEMIFQWVQMKKRECWIAEFSIKIRQKPFN